MSVAQQIYITNKLGQVMKLSVLLVFLLILPSAYAISTNLLPTYQPGETIIIKIEGNILEPISHSDVVFKRNHVAVAVDYNIKKILGNYYLYAQAPTNNNNYTLFIKGISTTVNGQVTELDFNQSFSVSGNITDYSISPGFAISNSNNLQFTIISNLDQQISIMVNFPDEQGIPLNPGTNAVSLSTAGKNSGFYEILIGKYKIPVQIISITNNQTIVSQSSLLVTPTTIKRIILSNSNYSFNVSLTNNGSSALQNIQFSFNENLFSIYPQSLTNLESQETKDVTITLLKTSMSKMDENILIYNSNEQLNNLRLNLSFTSDSNKTSINNNDTLEAQYYCSELNGVFCSANELCSSEAIQALDGLCCTGTCSIEEESSFGWLGYLSIVIVIGILLFIYLKYKKSAIPKTSNPSMINPLAKKI